MTECGPVEKGTGEGNGNPLQYSGLENPMDGGAWQAAVHGVANSWARLPILLIIHSFLQVLLVAFPVIPLLF